MDRQSDDSSRRADSDSHPENWTDHEANDPPNYVTGSPPKSEQHNKAENTDKRSRLFTRDRGVPATNKSKKHSLSVDLKPPADLNSSEVDGKFDRTRHIVSYIVYSISLLKLHYTLCTVYTLYAKYTMHCIHYVLYTLYTVHYIHHVQYTLYTMLYVLYTLYTIYTVHYVNYTICTLCIIHHVDYTLYSI